MDSIYLASIIFKVPVTQMDEIEQKTYNISGDNVLAYQVDRMNRKIKVLLKKHPLDKQIVTDVT